MKLVVMVQIETEDPRLDPGCINVSTAESTAELRRLVVENLPLMTRVVAVLDEETARLMVETHNRVCEKMGLPGVVRPPGSYQAPKDQN